MSVTDSKSRVHRWELQGLGRGPFRCEGVFRIPDRALAEWNPLAYQAELQKIPMGFGVGTCAVCGMSLVNNFLIRSTCGNTFSVGCECVKKTGDYSLIKAADLMNFVAVGERRRKAREDERQARLDQQRANNGGLTDWELQQQQLEKQQAEELNEKVRRGQAIAVVIRPIVDALSQDGGGFCKDMADLLGLGELPNGRALDICVAIYGKRDALSRTGKSRGRLYSEAKVVSKSQARQWFSEAQLILEHLDLSSPVK
ncbi:MAG: hypothetical protein D6160_20595 [Ketobacter sp.]|nr:MAG: hypothetical protein D6160_20595 [Ketobacter sp.]